MALATVCHTCHCQIIKEGDQVAYVEPVKLELSHRNMQAEIKGGRLKVSRVVGIILESEAWAECDALYRLILANGDKIISHHVAKTDGEFRNADEQDISLTD